MDKAQVNECLRKARGLTCTEEWEAAYEACKDKSLDEIKHPKLAYWLCWYAKNVIKGRWIEAEKHIIKDGEWLCWYAIYVIKDCWAEVEEYLYLNIPQCWANLYIRYWGIETREVIWNDRN